MVINVIKVVVNIFLPYLGLIIFVKKAAYFQRYFKSRVEKIATYSFGDYPNWDNIPNYE
jgi:uncharacterized protein YacL